jgi:hypothetical protein
LNQDDRARGGVQSADASIRAGAVAAGSLKLDAQTSRLLGESRRGGCGDPNDECERKYQTLHDQMLQY